MSKQSTILVFGATGQTGKHFVSQALDEGHKVKAMVRDPAKLLMIKQDLEVRQGSISDVALLDGMLEGVDYVIAMLGDAQRQRTEKINTAFIQKLVPAMRRQNVKRLLYQAGAFSKPYKGHLPPILWTMRHTLALAYAGQHEDNEAVMAYLTDEASDMEWIVHRAAIESDGASKGFLVRSAKDYSPATFSDCAAYNYRTLLDPSAIHTCDTSCYRSN